MPMYMARGMPPYGGMVSFYLQPGAPGATEPQLHWPGLTPLLGPSWRHVGAWSPSIFNRGAGSNRASVALAWVDPPSGPILAPCGGMVFFYLQPGDLAGRKKQKNMYTK